MLKGFKEFLMKGNVVDLAVAVVIGAAFTAIVKAFTDSIINPLIARIGGKGEIGLGFQLGDANDPTTFVNIGAVITAAINFVIIAAVVYFVIVMPYEKLKSIRAAHGEEDLTEQELLTEIRDLLSGKDPKAAKALDQAKAAGAITGPGLDDAAGAAAGAAAQPVTQHFSAAGAAPSAPFNTPEPFNAPEPFKSPEPFSASEPYKAPDAFGNPEPYSSPEPFKAPEPFGSNEAYSATPGGATPEPSRPSEPFSGRSDAFGTPAGSGFSSPAERFEPPRPSGPPSGAFPAQPPSGAFPAQRPPSGSFPAQPPSGPTVVPPTGGPHTPPPPPVSQPGGWNPPPPAGPPQNAPGQGAPNPGNADPFGTTRMSGTDPGARDQFGRPIDDRFNGPQGPGPQGGNGNGGQHGRHQQ